MTYQVKIELISDLAAQNGSTYGFAVDSDVIYDSLGFPFIPAKRLKGLLLEAYLDYVDITGCEVPAEEYFGQPDDQQTSMYISDAILKNREDYSSANLSDKAYVQMHFIHSRTQTAVDEKTGIAKEGTLRTTNTIKKGNSFLFTIESKIPEEVLNNILSLLRHMGANRTRGLGEVKCTLVKKYETKSNIKLPDMDDDKEYTLVYLTKAENSLLIASANRNETMDYIPGSSLLGFFAYQYLQTHKADETFDALFNKGGIKFSNGYISDAAGTAFYPLPSYLAKEKAGNVFYNTLKYERSDETEAKKLKPLSNRYGCFDNQSITIKNIASSFNYHHKRDKERIADGLIFDEDHPVTMAERETAGSFYQYYSLDRNQYFQFTIHGKGKDLKKAISAVDKIHVGKSRTAQYGTLTIQKISIKEERRQITSNHLVLDFVSPIVFLNDKGDYSFEIDDLIKALKKRLSMNVSYESFAITTKAFGGYNMTWNKQKPTFYAIDKGGYVVLKLENSVSLPEMIFFSVLCQGSGNRSSRDIISTIIISKNVMIS